MPFTSIDFDCCRTQFLGIKFFTFNEKKIETYTSTFRILYIIFNFVKNCLHVYSLILFLGVRNIPEVIWSISKGCPPLHPTPSPAPHPLLQLQTNIAAYTSTFPAVPKKKLFDPTLFICVNGVADMTCRRFMFRSKLADRHFAHLWIFGGVFCHISLEHPGASYWFVG